MTDEHHWPLAEGLPPPADPYRELREAAEHARIHNSIGVVVVVADVLLALLAERDRLQRDLDKAILVTSLARISIEMLEAPLRKSEERAGRLAGRIVDLRDSDDLVNETIPYQQGFEAAIEKAAALARAALAKEATDG